MESLQFQDITAQQMDHAASLLEEVEIKLHGILTTLGSPETMSADMVPQVPRKTRAYDPHADFVDRKTDQKDIDSLFAKKGN
jgi:chemotaxis regulatin CheY-phosphate phosphatase CheZ